MGKASGLSEWVAGSPLLLTGTGGYMEMERKEFSSRRLGLRGLWDALVEILAGGRM